MGGARKACDALGMTLPDLDKLISIAKYSNSHSNPIPSGWYWSSVGKNDHGDVTAAKVVLFKSGNTLAGVVGAGSTGHEQKYDSGIKAVCIGK